VSSIPPAAAQTSGQAEPVAQVAGGQAPAEAMKGCLGFLASLIVVGVIAESLYKISPSAAYLFVAVVLIGYSATGANLDKVTGFLSAVQGQTGGKK
jgi:hypothetical protein